jgi:hypothetical protein
VSRSNIKTGWWRVKIELTLEGKEILWRDLSDLTREHIVQSLMDDCYQGEIVEKEDEPDDPDDNCSHCANDCGDEDVCENCEYKSE